MAPEAKDIAGNSGNPGVRARVTGIYSRLVLLARELPEQMSSGENADIIIVTNEDPYDEEPMKIIEEVAGGVNSQNLYKILDFI